MSREGWFFGVRFVMIFLMLVFDCVIRLVVVFWLMRCVVFRLLVIIVFWVLIMVVI